MSKISFDQWLNIYHICVALWCIFSLRQYELGPIVFRDIVSCHLSKIWNRDYSFIMSAHSESAVCPRLYDDY